MSLQAIAQGIQQYLALKAKRPELSVDIAKSKTAKEVGEHIASAWVGYGLEKDVKGGDNQVKMTIETDPETFSSAMRYLWFHPKKEGDVTTYKMGGMKYVVDVKVDGKKHELIVREA
jgi:hypothetical protein